jgi:hypothetical protein
LLSISRLPGRRHRRPGLTIGVALALLGVLPNGRAAAPDAPQSTAVPSQSQPSSSPGFTLGTIQIDALQPAEVSANEPVVGSFELGLEAAGPTAQLRAYADNIAARLRVNLGGKEIANSNATIGEGYNPSLGKSGATYYALIRGSFTFTMTTFDMLTWPPTDVNQVVFLTDPQTGAKSNFRTVRVRKGAAWAMVLVGALAPLLALGATWGVLKVRRGAREARAAAARVSAGFGPSTREAAEAPVEPAEIDPEPVDVGTVAPEVPDALASAIAERQGVLVLGAGASAQAGYPAGDMLLDLLVERLDTAAPDTTRRAIASGQKRARRDRPLSAAARVTEFGNIIDALVATAGRDAVVKAIRGIFENVKPDRLFHALLASLPWQVVLSLVLDTLADDCFSDQKLQAKWRGEPRLVLAYEEASELLEAIRAGRPLFVRGVGDLARPASVALTADDLRRNLARNPDFQRQLALLLQTRVFLFIGIGTETLKQFLQAIGSDLEVSTPRHYALVPHSSENDIYVPTLLRFGVTMLQYDPREHHAEVARFAGMLKTKVDALPVTTPAAQQAVNKELAGRRISSLKLRNIGPFDELALTFATKPLEGTGAAPWTIVFGTNGIGKSSILRAIGLVLAGGDREAQAAAARLLKTGRNDAEIEVGFGPDVLRTRLVRDRGTTIQRSVQTSPVEAGQALVLGFPALRGARSNNPHGPATQERRPAEPADLTPMVNGLVDARLANFKQWIINLLEAAGRRDPRAVVMKTLMDNILRDLVPGQFRRLAPLDSSYVVRVRATDDDVPPGPDDVPFDNLSQGMASIFNWVGVLAQRLADFYPNVDKPEQESAIVLVDEIDAHLHPDWQRRLVELMRKFFPRVQVIATSHSSLLAGALHGPELCVLVREPGSSKVRPLPFQIDLYGLNSSDILTSAIFGMTTDRNPDAERSIKRYFELYEKVSRTDEEKKEMDGLEKVLKGVRYAGMAPETLSDDDPLDGLNEEQVANLRSKLADTAQDKAST